MLHRLTAIFTRFAAYLVRFGPRVTYYYLVYPRIGGKKAFLRRHEEIKRYLKNRYSGILDRYRNLPRAQETIPEDAPIWVCWLQGEDQMPEVVRLCYASVKRHACGRPVHLVDLNSIPDWVDVPVQMRNMLEQGKLSCAHYADYLRILLLREHGGLWMDAKIFVTGDLKEDPGCSFYSIRQKSTSIHYVSGARWVVGLLGAPKGHPLFCALEELFREYVTSCPVFIDFFLFDYMIAVLYDESPGIKDGIDALPHNNERCYDLLKLRNDEYDQAKFDEIMESTMLHILSWRERDYRTSTPDGKPTCWGILQEEGR